MHDDPMVPRLRRVLKFFVSGGSSAALTMAALFVLHGLLGIWHVLAATIAWFLGVLLNFTLQRRWVFESASPEGRRQFFLFCAVNAVNAGLNALLMYLFVDLMGFHYLVSECISLGLLACLSFACYRVIFRA